MSKYLAAIFFIVTMPAIAAPPEVCSKNICVSGAWARATPPGAQSAAVYFSVVNKGRAADTLLSASSSATASAMLHRSVMAGSVVHMDMVGSVELSPGARLTLAPIGYHLMLDGLKQRLTEGTTISVSLDFAKAGELMVSVPVLGITAAGPHH